MSSPPDPAQSLVARLLGPAEPEVSCDECFDRLDRFVDAELRGIDASAALPGMRAHFDGCPACREDYESLHAYVATPRDATHPATS